jgi:glycosyltransferase involved in cell wall biosynthesis
MSSMSENPIPVNSLSLVIPMYQERDNVQPMLVRVHQALADFPSPWELICVDDGSTDGTHAALLSGRATFGRHIRPLRLQRNYGQTAAMQAGIDAARGDFIATLDGDLQNDPADIPRMLAELQQRDLDLLQGWRQKRQDEPLRKFFSRQANRLIGRVTGVKLHDYGCSLKVYRAEVIKQVRLFGEMHRFIPIWVAGVTSPERIGETAVTHQARRFGTSKYGLSRTFRVIQDLLAVFFFLRFRARPGHFFGSIGLLFGAIGGLLLVYLSVLKLFLGEDIGNRPLLFLGILLVVVSIQFISTGVLAELMARTYFESSDGRAYILARAQDRSADDWYGRVSASVPADPVGTPS